MYMYMQRHKYAKLHLHLTNTDTPEVSVGYQGPVPLRPIKANPGLKFCSTILYFLSIHCLVQHFVLLLLFLRLKASHYVVNLSYMFLDKKTLLKIWLNPGSNLTIIRRTGSSMVDSQREWLEASHIQQALVE